MATEAPLSKADQWSSKEFWRALFPALHIEDVDYLGTVSLLAIDDALGENLRGVMRQEGYFQLPPPPWQLPIEDMASLVSKLDAAAIPLPFAFLFDEFWVLFIKLNKLIETQIGAGFHMLPDFWVWHVDPRKGEGGWTPHRDRGSQALRPDGSPKSVTVWIPLSESNTLNGCMYMVPADRDPTYGTDQDSDWKFAYSDIRALPAAAGSIFMWNQAVLHWGSRGSPREQRPRISTAFEFQAGDVPPYNTPLMVPNELPGFASRLRLIGKQILQYQHMYPLSPEIRDIAERMKAG